MTRQRRSGPRPTPPATRAATRFGAVALVAVGALALGACGDDGGDGDLVAFCDAVAGLREADPFAELEVARPAEMREAFEALADGADRIADAAPGDADIQADRYRDAVDALRDELAGGGFDPRRVDARRYARAADDYAAAADSLDNAADARC